MNYTPTFRLALPAFDYEPWDGEVNGNFTILDALVNTVVGVPGFVGIWLNNTQYSVGQVAVDAQTGQLFECNVFHTSAAGGSFDAERTANPTYWTLTRSSATEAAGDAQASAAASADSAQAAEDAAQDALDQAIAAAASAAEAAQSASDAQVDINTRVAKAGDVMTGLLTLSGNPTAPLGAVTKQYADNKFLPFQGGTMQGPLILWRAPQDPFEATTKQYVDGKTGSTLSDAPADGSYYGRMNQSWQKVIPITGGVVSGGLSLSANLVVSGTASFGNTVTLSADPTQPLQAATKQYADSKLTQGAADGRYLSLSGGTVSGNVAVTGTMQINGFFTMVSGAQNNYGRYVSYTQTAGHGNPSFCCWDGNQNWAAGMFGGSGTRLCFGNMNAQGDYIGPLYGAFDGSGSFRAENWITSNSHMLSGGGQVFMGYDQDMWCGRPNNGWRYYRFGGNWGWQWRESDGYMFYSRWDGGNIFAIDGSGNATASGNVTGNYVRSTGDVRADGNLNAGSNLNCWDCWPGGTYYTNGMPYSAARIHIQNGNNLQFRWDGTLLARLDESSEIRLPTAWNWNYPDTAGGAGGPTNIAQTNGDTYNGVRGIIFYDGWSDGRIKENIRDSSVDALSKINSLKLREFDFRAQYSHAWDHPDYESDKTKGYHQELGFVAQEVAEQFPDIVRKCIQPEHGVLDVKDIHVVNNKALVPYLVKAIQQLTAANEQLQARIAKLEGKRH